MRETPKTRCKVCNHPQRERVEQALANACARINGGLRVVAERFGLNYSACHRHLTNHMDSALVARLRLGVPSAIDGNIEDVIREEGEGAIIGLRKLKEQHQLAADRLEKMGEFDLARKERTELRKVYSALAEYAGMIPGRKGTTNNTLVLGDSAQLFELVSRVLQSADSLPAARAALAAEYQRLAGPAPLEHER